ncbi:MAG TPA: rhodanese-like domain-containing protein [Gammaproteobacteria bacterium]|nr:rhodanese-like domain-containing protein [Gammaproteobacteria bacterium]
MTDRDVESLTPGQAWELVQGNPRAVLIDVRSTMEYLFVGHPRGALHVPWIDEPAWTVNPHFVAQVRMVLLGGASCETGDCAPVVLICRSGKRSLEAGRELIRQGLTDVYNVLEGFEGELDEAHHRSTVGGWRFHGLPWEQC